MAKANFPEPIRGVYAALATPRRPGSTEVDTAAFFDYQDAIVRGGVNGLVLFGSTGEFIHFDLEDRMHAVSLIIKRSRIPVLVNVSHSSLDGALALAETAVLSGAAGLLLMPPYFYRYGGAQLLAFYQRFAELAAGCSPLFLYNIPFFTNPIPFAVIESLVLTGLYVGIKDSSGDPDLFRDLNALHAAHPFVWLTGNESLYLKARSSGADGIVSGIAAAVPELIVALDHAICEQAFDRATALNETLAEFLMWVNKFPATVAIKQAAVARGWKLDHAPFPFDGTTNSEIEAFRTWFRKWLPSVLQACTEPLATARIASKA